MSENKKKISIKVQEILIFMTEDLRGPHINTKQNGICIHIKMEYVYIYRFPTLGVRGRASFTIFFSHYSLTEFCECSHALYL